MLFVYFFVFIFGAVIGSFLNCLIYRLEEGKGFVKGRSFCPKCKHQLGFWDLIPIFSFLVLQGKCRYCRKSISFQYPLVEIAAGVLLIFNFKFLIFSQFLIFNFKFFITALYLIFLTSSLLVIFVYDLKHYIIPDKVLWPAVGAAFIYKIFNFQFLIFKQFSINRLFNFQTDGLVISVLSGLGAAFFFFSIWAVSRGRWLGFGDVKLAFLLGLFLGWPHILVGLFSGFFLGAIIGIGLILLKKKTIKSQVPFGPFLIGGAFLALFWSKEIINWYFNLFNF